MLQVEGDTVDFFVIADQGGIPEPPYYTHILSYVSNLMKVMAKQENTQFQFALGDNFYFDGVKSVDDERFNVFFQWFLNKYYSYAFFRELKMIKLVRNLKNSHE